jgi:hypothetical protein
MNNVQPIIEFTGKPATVHYGMIAPAAYGKTTLSINSNTVIERTKRIIATRYCEAPIAKIDSVEIVEDGNPLLLLLGFGTLMMMGLGIVFFVLYFVMKYKYLVVRSGNNIQIVMISNMGGDTMEKAKRFSATLIQGMLQKSYQPAAPQRTLSPAEQMARQQQMRQQQTQNQNRQ